MRNLRYALDQLRLLVADHLILSALKIAPSGHRDTLHIATAMRLYADLRMADIASETGKGKFGQRPTKAGPDEKLALHARAIAAEARLAEAVKLMEPFASVTTADGLPDGFLRIPDDHPFLFNATGFPGEETWKPVVTVGHLRAARAFVDSEKNLRKVTP
ncbi:hypothetical protein [Ciceribacter ferrooxidans]|uniref:Uncharacterized protein n=1 Tax=Ciceribacter ferrooxidans TaxID=2509717 RepID=A0A4Q2SZU2_9HYPH|nr:hypothetical protein [Ciceribacter ferrooxidans]RYC10130.1 hypothetical protein EUU22_18860 [Ciceribacter ferrooxidans]